MKIDLKELPDGIPVNLRESRNPQGLELDTVGVKIVNPIRINLELIKFSDILDIKADLQAEARIQCSRCLEETDLKITKKIRLDYSLEKQDTILDISDDIRQEVMLEYPLKPLCFPDCKGLCIKCGENLNKGDCKCEARSV